MYFIYKGRLDVTKPITIKALHDAGVFGTAKFGVKLIGRGLETIDRPLHFEVSDASESVIAAIKAKGGSVKCVYRTALQQREHIFPEKYPINLNTTVPPKRVVKRMEAIRDRGAEVVYTIPNWQQKVLSEEAKITKEEKEAAEKDNFVLPVPRFPGSGKDKIRVRKNLLPKQINFKL